MIHKLLTMNSAVTSFSSAAFTGGTTSVVSVEAGSIETVSTVAVSSVAGASCAIAKAGVLTTAKQSMAISIIANGRHNKFLTGYLSKNCMDFGVSEG